MGKLVSSRKQCKTLARNLADRATSEKIQMRALEILFALEQADKPHAKRVKTGGLSDLLNPAETEEPSDQTSGH